jgi:hypothetical protein
VVSITLDSALNLLWLAISLGALIRFGRIERSRADRGLRCGRFRGLFAVCMLAVAIFPTVSDSDDLFNFSLLHVPTSHRGSVGSVPAPVDSREKDTVHLARVLETLEHFEVNGFYTFAFVLFSIAACISLRPVFASRAVCCSSGRAPPLS